MVIDAKIKSDEEAAHLMKKVFASESLNFLGDSFDPHSSHNV